MDDLLREFLTETAENLSVLDVELVRFEQNPQDETILGNIFRLVHTIKGTCGFLGLPRLERVAHAGENVLGKFRDRALVVTPSSVSLILRSLDRIKEILGALEQTGVEPDGSDEELIEQLHRVERGEQLDDDIPAAAPEPVAPAAAAAEAKVPAVQAQTAVVEQAAATAVSSEPAEPAARQAQGGPGGAAAAESSVANQSIRVSVDLLENLMTTVSELVLTRNQLLQILRSSGRDSEFAAPLQRLNHVTSELQEGVMKTRMQPIGNAWSKLPRLVRDLSHDLKKKVDLQMLGAETELDRQVLELIRDPLTHMVRNSIDHGLEMPVDRVAAGKSEVGCITLNAFHEGGHILIEISDDGKGLNVEAIRRKAIQNGLVSELEAAEMADQQIYQFVFKAGFSTAAAVTSVSGRGVGMDVVKTNIEKIGGTVDLKSQPGRGTTFTIKIPLTLAIVSALIIECGGERFALPQISVMELVRAVPGGEHRIERIKGTPVLRLRNRLLPLVSLSEMLKLETRDHEKTETFIVVAQVGANIFGIIVDQVFDTEEIVVKPVAPILRHIGLFSGNTILGDGSVIMILDPNGIASAAGEMQQVGESAAQTAAAVQRGGASRSTDAMTLLIFRAGNNTPKAVALSLVARLEDFDTDTIELSNGQPVVQYRGSLMPLVPCDPAWELKPGLRCPVLVFADRDRAMGLVVDEIIDIVEDRLQIQLGTERPGFFGSAIIAGRATEVIDSAHYLRQAFNDWFGSDDDAGFEAVSNSRVLLVDDSPFFRNLLTPLLTMSGYNVTAVEQAQEVLNLCDNGGEFDVIVSDIEMPGMNGFDLARAVRATARWADIPMVALSSHANARDRERGRQAGFNYHVAKFDRDALLAALHQCLGQERSAAA
jgi:two-component system chemotaxis sensor kinase CheA